MRTELNPVHLNLTTLSDDELLSRLSDLLKCSRRDEVELVAHIAEVDARWLYAREAAPSMFAYCTEVLHLSEFEAYLRIAVARASRRHPAVLVYLADGRLHLTAVAKLAPHLTPENADALLRRATHRSKRQLRELIAELAPRPDAPTIVRRLPDRRGAQAPVAEAHFPVALEARLEAVRHVAAPASSAVGPSRIGAQLGLDRVEPSRLNHEADAAVMEAPRVPVIGPSAAATDAGPPTRRPELGVNPVPIPAAHPA